MARPSAAVPFTTIQAAPDVRTVCDRVEDVLSESHREDTPEEFRLGLLQGALAIALPLLRTLESRPKRRRPIPAAAQRRRSRA